MRLAKLSTLHRDVTVSHFDPDLFLGCQWAAIFGSPCHERFNQLFLSGFVPAVNDPLQDPTQVSQGKFPMNWQEFVPALFKKLPGALFVSGQPVGLRLIDRIRRRSFRDRDIGQPHLHRRISPDGLEQLRISLAIEIAVSPMACESIESRAGHGAGGRRMGFD